MSLTTCVLGPVGAHCTQSHTPGQLLSCTPLSVTLSAFPVDLVLALDSKEWCGSSPRAVFPVCCAVLCCDVSKGGRELSRGGGAVTVHLPQQRKWSLTGLCCYRHREEQLSGQQFFVLDVPWTVFFYLCSHSYPSLLLVLEMSEQALGQHRKCWKGEAISYFKTIATLRWHS